MTSPSSTVGRRRGMIKQMSTEDQALNMIAREAEARLAAKRAARAEARSIRMNELEKMQKEADEQINKEFERDAEDSIKKKTPSRLNSSDLSTITPTSETQNTNIKETLRDIEEKYRKAMVNIAQLDNERQALQYQVECLKDNVEDLQESLGNVTDELMHKTKDYNKLNKEHTDLEELFLKCSNLLKDRERILDEHGINLDGTLKEAGESDEDETIVEMHSKTNSVPINYLTNDSDDMLSEIEKLREEVRDLKRENSKTDADVTQKEAESLRPELERSFVDVSDEANAIRQDRVHTGLFVNNNEKCDEFEVIDNGSQAGGMRHFEDKSFEKSGRSSLLSSVRTDEVASENELPFEISVEREPPKDDYEIIMNDKSVTHLSPTGNASDINVNKYLFNESESDAEKSNESADTLNVNQYFTESLDVKRNRTDVDDEAYDTIENSENDVVNGIDNVKGYETIDVPTPVHESRQSPYVELEREDAQEDLAVSDCAVIIDDTITRDLNTCMMLESSVENEVRMTTEVTASCEQKEETIIASDCDDLEGELDACQPIVDTEAKSHHPGNEIETNIEVEYRDNASPEPVLLSDSSSSKNLSHDVLALYDKIAQESSSDRNEATFGVFGQFNKRESGHGSGANEPSIPEESAGKKGCLVRVESFSQPQPTQPHIQVLNSDRQESAQPQAKERKKKNKRKRKDKNSLSRDDLTGVDDTSNLSSTMNTFVNSSGDASPVVEKNVYTDADIPAQFLDVSQGLGDSLSDCSDTDDIDKRNAKKANKKDGCKNQ